MDIWFRYKKIIIISAFIIVSVIIGYTIYRLFFQPLVSPPGPGAGPAPTTTVPGGGFPPGTEGPGQTAGVGAGEGDTGEPSPLPPARPSPVANGGLTAVERLSESESLGLALDPLGNEVRYYDKSDGRFYRINKQGQQIPLSDEEFYNVESIAWSPDSRRAILEYPDGSNIVYDFETDSQITLPQHWEDFDFSASGNQVVMKSLGLDPNNRWLAVANADGSAVRAIENIGENADTVYPSWSNNNQIVGLYTKGVDFDRQEVFFIGQNDENFKSTIIEGRGFEHQWSPEGKQLLYSVYSSKNDMKPSLWVVNAQGDEIGSGRKNLNIETWARKCAYSSKSEVFCAVPESLPDAAGLFPELAENSRDRLVRIDTDTGRQTTVAIPDGEYRMENLRLSDNGYNLYFTDADTGNIHSIKLK